MMVQIVGTANHWEMHPKTVSLAEPRTIAMGVCQKDSVGVRKNQGKKEYPAEKSLVSNLP
jgi:hypothetical protein